MELTQYQSRVGDLLTRGSALLQVSDLTADQEAKIRQQVELLNQQWEELRVGAMERQTR